MKTSTKLWIALSVLAVLTPLGLLAKGTAWGEWSSGELAGREGIVPEGLARLERLWRAVLGGYELPGWNAGWRAALGYAVSAALGCAIVGGSAFLLGKWLTARKGRR